IRRLVATLDIPIRQVLIEARIVIVNDDFTRELGVRAGYNTFRSNGDGAVYAGGSASAVDTALQGGITNANNNITNGLPGGATAGPWSVPTGPGGMLDRYNVNLPIVSPAGRLAFAVLGSDYIVDL